MDKRDTEFWNGVLKGVIISEEELDSLAKKLNGSQKESLELAVERLEKVKKSIEQLHGQDLRSFLSQYA